MTPASSSGQTAPTSRFGSRRELLLLTLILLYAGSFRLLTLDRPFHYDGEATGCFNGVLARNYLDFSLAETHGMPVMSVGSIAGAPLVFYNHHPPTVPLLIAPVYAIFGVGEWQTRLPTAIATVASSLVLFLLVSRCGDRRIALIAAALFAALPMNLYFGGMPEVLGMPLVPFVLISVIAYLELHRESSGRALASLIGWFALAAVTDWPAFVVVPIYLVHFMTTRPRRDWPKIFVFCAAAAGLFFLVYAYIVLATGSPWDWMAGPAGRRSGISGTDFSAAEWWGAAVKYNLDRHTLPVLLGSAAWLVAFAWRRDPPRSIATAARLLLGWGVLQLLVGHQGALDHEWWWWPLTPGLAVSAAVVLDAAARALARWTRPWAYAFAIAGGLSLFAAWTTTTAYRELYPVDSGGGFTAFELGQAIRYAAPEPNDVAMLMWSGASPQEWFYGDRPLRQGIWSVEDFEYRLSDDRVELFWYYEQRWPATAAGFVFPRTYVERFDGLLGHLRRHYREVSLPAELSANFLVFDLRRPPVHAPAASGSHTSQ